MPSPLIQFRAIDQMAQQLTTRSNVPEQASESALKSILSETARRDLDRYYNTLVRSLPKFSVEEASLLLDALNGCISEPHSVQLLWANIADAVQEGYDKKWEVDGPALVERLRKLSYAECMAVTDAVERFWYGPYRQEGPLEPRLREVGLVK